MKKLAFATVLFLFSLSSPSIAQQTRSLKVKASYAGPGEVDQTHQIHLFVFDTPNIQAGTMPIGFGRVAENGGTVQVNHLTAETVYLVGVYDEKGTYNSPQGPPPAGTPVSFYKPGSPEPSPINLKETSEIEFVFDDSDRMP